MNQKILSVCIPVYNGEEYIEEAILSVLEQSFKDYELLIIDNQSTDNTYTLLQKFTDPRIKLFRNDTNLGLVGNFNRALELAEGKYIKILPADDFLYPGCLQMQVDVLEQDKENKIALVCGRKNIINAKGKVLFNRGFANKRTEVSGFDAINKVVRAGGNIIGEAGAVMFRKDIIAKAGLFSNDVFYALDLELFFKMLCFGNLYALPDVVSSFRISNNSTSVHVVDRQRADLVIFFNKIYADKKFNLSWTNYKMGLMTSWALTNLK